MVADEFRIVDRIGAGGMGGVYKAEQPEMNRFVAVKILHRKYTDRPDLVSRFKREARAMSHLSHPNTSRVFTYGQLEDGAWYIVMEYMEGKNLAQMVRIHGPFEPTRAIQIVIQVCGALEEAHRGGIVHRDIKPENIFLTKQGGIEDFPKVLDFGLAKVSERQMRPGSMVLTQEGMVFGTVEFMSPEQAKGETLDGRADVYSLACVLYEMLTGKLPFDAKEPLEFVNLHIKATPISLADRAPERQFPPGLQSVLNKAMAKKPGDRFESAALFAKALKDCLAGSLSGSVLSSALPSASASADRQTPADGVANRATGKLGPGDVPVPVSNMHWIVLGIGVTLFVAASVMLIFRFAAN
jgi:serine/threonine protein kinase